MLCYSLSQIGIVVSLFDDIFKLNLVEVTSLETNIGLVFFPFIFMSNVFSNAVHFIQHFLQIFLCFSQ